MKKILVVCTLCSSLVACQSANEAFSLKKKNTTDEFLVEKKNPLVMPPNFGKLPMPKNIEDKEVALENDSIENLIGSDNDKTSDLKEGDSNTSIEKLILEKIN